MAGTNKANLRQHAKRKTSYEVQRKRTEMNKLRRQERHEKRVAIAARALPKHEKRVVKREESPTERDIRHMFHKAMKAAHELVKWARHESRFRHNKHSTPPITLV